MSRKKKIRHEVECDACGDRCFVPFKPDGIRKTFCWMCYRKNKRRGYFRDVKPFLKTEDRGLMPSSCTEEEYEETWIEKTPNGKEDNAGYNCEEFQKGVIEFCKEEYKIEVEFREYPGSFSAVFDLTNQRWHRWSDEEISKVAKKTKCLTGKWMIQNVPSIHVDRLWRCVQDLVDSVESISIAKVNVRKKERARSKVECPGHLIIIWTKDYTNQKDVMFVRDEMRKRGFNRALLYKADVYTELGVYSHNKKKLGLKRVTQYKS